MKVHQVVAAALSSHGVGVVFGLMGDANMLYLTDYIRDHGGRFVRCAFEGSSVSMADGYSRSTGRLGVSSVTHGPALTNTLTALVEAVRAGSRILLITGTTPAVSGYLQDIDVLGLSRLAGAGYARVYRPSTAGGDVVRALQQVHAAGRPVVLDVPYDLLQCDVDEVAPPSGAMRIAPPGSGRPDSDVLDDALGLALSARRPVVLAGRGAVRAGTRDELVALADMLGAPLATSLLAKDYFRGHPGNLGVCGTVGSGLATGAIATSDCVLAFGASLNAYTADHGHLLGPKQRIIQCDADPASIGLITPVKIGIIADARATAAAMVESLAVWPDRPKVSPDENLLRDLAATPHEPYKDRSTDTTVDLRTAMLRLDEMLPADRALVTDVGRFMGAPWKYLHVAEPSAFTHTASFGSIGLGLATAVGVALGRPDRPTVAVLGDGGFMMNLQELHAVVRNEIPLVIVIANDSVYGAEWRKLVGFGVDPEYSRSVWPDFTKLSRSVGIDGVTVRNLADLEGLVPRLSCPTQPVLIDLRIDPTLDIGY